MSINLIPPSIVIKRLKTAREHIGKTEQDFQIWGAGEFLKANESSYFAKDSTGARIPVLVAGCAAATGNALHIQGNGENIITHGIDVHLIIPMLDPRAQVSDEVSVWFKEFLLKTLQGFNPSSGANPLIYSGDTLTGIAGVAGYSRSFSFSQSILISDGDLYGGDENTISGYGDLDEFLYIGTNFETEAPSFSEISETALDINLR